AAAYVPGLPALGAMLLLGGAAAASVNAATGRVIVGWFPPHRRGLAMGVRQAAQPLGVGLGALILPASAAVLGATGALVVPAALQRIDMSSFLLVVPPFTVWTFALVWLIDRCGWSPGSAGALIVAAQVLGGLGRMAAGSWSDVVGSRLLPIRIIAGAAALTM